MAEGIRRHSHEMLWKGSQGSESLRGALILHWNFLYDTLDSPFCHYDSFPISPLISQDIQKSSAVFGINLNSDLVRSVNEGTFASLGEIT